VTLSGTLLPRHKRDYFGRRQAGCRQWREVKPGHIGSARKFDADCRFPFRFKVVLGQLLANFCGFDADHGIVRCVVIYRAPEHLGPNHPLSQAIELACQSMSYDQLEKVLGTFASRERMTRRHLFEVIPH
jgi:hypothetical protein